MKIFFYPPKGSGHNPYINNFIQSLSSYCDKVLICDQKAKLPSSVIFLHKSWNADVYILNWIENVANDRLKFIGAILCLLGLKIIKSRKAKIIWICHNIHPHEGESFWSNKIKHFLFKNSTFIIAHSKEAEEYAKKHSDCHVFFKNHPMKVVDYGVWSDDVKECDLFYWGDISPYKGVVEFLSHPLCKQSDKKIFIIGKSTTKTIQEQIETLTSNNIIYENRQADFREIAAQCKKAKYVIFPYIGESISSSGVLMDTILMGGTPIGPNRGAFADLASQGCCITYNNLDEIFALPTDDEHIIKLDDSKVRKFINDNTWEAFGQWIFNMIMRHDV